MAIVTYVRTIKYVAEILGEDPKFLQAIASRHLVGLVARDSADRLLQNRLLRAA